MCYFFKHYFFPPQVKLLLPDLLRKREHSGSSRDSGYSSYFGVNTARPAAVDTTSANLAAAHRNSNMQLTASNNNSLHLIKPMHSAVNNYGINTGNSSHEINSTDKFNRFSKQSPYGDMLFSRAVSDLSSFNNSTMNHTLDFQSDKVRDSGQMTLGTDSMLASLSHGVGVTGSTQQLASQFNPVNASSFNEPKNIPWLNMDSSSLVTTNFNSLNLRGNESGRSSVLPSSASALQFDPLASQNVSFDSNNVLSSSAFRSNLSTDLTGMSSANTNAVNGVDMFQNNMRMNLPNPTNTVNDDKLSQLLPSDPTAQKNFLDNIQLLNQLSSIAPLEDVESIIPAPVPPGIGNNLFKNSRDHINSFNQSSGVLLNGHKKPDLSEGFILSQILEHSSSSGVARSSENASMPSTAEDQILELATFLLTKCNNSNIDISLAEVQLMLRRAALQDLYAKNWLTRNFILPKSKPEQFPCRPMSFLDTPQNGYSQHKNFQDKHLYNNSPFPNVGGKYLSKSGNDLCWSKGEAVTTPNLESYEAMHHMRHDPRSMLGNLNTVDNFKITSLSNGGFITSKNCANFEKLTMHSSSKDLPCHFSQHFPPPNIAAVGNINNKNGYLSASSPQQSVYAKSQGYYAPESGHDYVSPSQYDLLPQQTASKSERDYLPPAHPSIQQRLAAEILAASSKIPPEVLARHHHKISPDLLSTHCPPSPAPPPRGLATALGGRYPPPSTLQPEYLRNFTPDLLSFQPSVMAYRQMG